MAVVISLLQSNLVAVVRVVPPNNSTNGATVAHGFSGEEDIANLVIAVRYLFVQSFAHAKDR